MSSAVGDDPHEITTSSVLRRDVPWETYLTARLISEPDLQLIRSYDKRSRATQEDLLAEVRCLLLRARAEVAPFLPCSRIRARSACAQRSRSAPLPGATDRTGGRRGLEPAWGAPLRTELPLSSRRGPHMWRPFCRCCGT